MLPWFQCSEIANLILIRINYFESEPAGRQELADFHILKL